MQNPVYSGLKTRLREFPDLLLSDERFPKESEKLLQLAFIILILSELNCWPKFQLMMRPIISLLYYLQRMPSVHWSINIIMPHQCLPQGENRTVRT